jgi:hypothetical protein
MKQIVPMHLILKAENCVGTAHTHFAGYHLCLTRLELN